MRLPVRAHRAAVAGCVILSLASYLGCTTSPRAGQASGALLSAARATDSVPHDPDDPALWIHPTSPEKSVILGTDKVAGQGGLYVFGLDGKQRRAVTPLDRPNNVDVEYGFRIGGRLLDIAVVTERLQHRLRVFGIANEGADLIDLAPDGIPVLQGESGEASEPMGIALYRRPGDGAVFAIVAPKTGGVTNYLWQYRLIDVNGVAQGQLVRRFGAFSRRGPVAGDIGEIEAVAVDDALGFVYYADERFGIHKWHADPDHPDAARSLALFGTDGYLGDREGLAVYTRPDGTGFLVSSDQIEGRSRLMLYRREGESGRPHEHTLIATLPTPADATDGLEVTSQALPGAASGILVTMNSGPRNFLIYDWNAVASSFTAR